MDAKERALILATIATALSLIPTAYVAAISNSIVLLGDFLRCAVEFLAIFLSYFVLRRVLRGDRTFYDFGLGKFEQLASLTIASAMLFTFFVVAVSAVQRLFYPLPVENAGAGFLLALLSVLGNSLFWWHYRSLSSRQSSPVIDSQANLFRAKAFASLVVTVTLFLSLYFPGTNVALLADPIGSLLLGTFLLYSAFGMFSASIRDLLDGAVDEAVRLGVLRELVTHEGLYREFQGIRTRRSGALMFIEVNLSFLSSLSIQDVTERCDRIASSLTQQLGKSDVLIIPRSS